MTTTRCLCNNRVPARQVDASMLDLRIQGQTHGTYGTIIAPETWSIEPIVEPRRKIQRNTLFR